MADPQRFTPEEMIRLAASAVAKVDLMGTRGTTLVTSDEVEALACLVALSGILPGRPSEPHRQPRYVENEGSGTCQQ